MIGEEDVGKVKRMSWVFLSCCSETPDESNESENRVEVETELGCGTPCSGKDRNETVYSCYFVQELCWLRMYKYGYKK